VNSKLAKPSPTPTPARPASSRRIARVALIGNHLPRQCGIATFTTDLCQALAQQMPAGACFTIPVNDIPEGYAYPEQVRYELFQDDLSTYTSAADFLNVSDVDLVCLQHEYGIFGGPAGSHILALLRELRMPLVTTLHTVLKHPDPNQRAVLQEIAALSDRLVVMTHRASAFLQDIYAVPPSKIDLIPHGIPDVPFVDPNFYKDQFGLEGKKVLLTFGLLSPNKGIERGIEALPDVVARHPDVVYLIVGATHPHILRKEGESYRLSLHRLARRLGVDRHVTFHARFVSSLELTQFLGAADIYLTPYLNPAQIVSGTLAYAVGCGKAVVSTPYWHAEELLAGGRGVLVPFNDSRALAAQLIHLLDNDVLRHAIRKRAYLFARSFTWPNAARAYLRCFAAARRQRSQKPRTPFTAATLADRPAELPSLNLAHLLRLTDSTGILQHAIFSIPNFAEGYTTDDNARAVLLSALAHQTGIEIPGAWRYLAFLWHAFNPETARFRNFLRYDRRWAERTGSEDAHGRALWALGAVIARSEDPGARGLALRLFHQALPAASRFTSPRAWAFLLLGCHEYLQRFPGDREAHSLRDSLASQLLRLFEQNQSPDWVWFEDIVSYSNPTLSHAMLTTGAALQRPSLTEVGLNTLRWLIELQTSPEGHFSPVGSNGFYRRGGPRPHFDQQPIEAGSMVSACLEAARITRDPYWNRAAQRALDWFLGSNDLNLSLYDGTTGGCRDGLHPGRANQNQGAEATLAFLTAFVETRQAAQSPGAAASLAAAS
jgi:glycosyltransferase involved in cell wall biosynthesis